MYELYNKNVKVADISEEGYSFQVIEPDLLPFWLRGRRSAEKFLTNRLQDIDRKYAKDIERLIGSTAIDRMIEKTALSSLNDTFWLKKDASDVSWEDVNLYDSKNAFNAYFFKAALSGLSEDDYLEYIQTEGLSPLITPELTTGGSYAKAWYRDEEYGLCLLKHGKRQYNNREVISEVLASEVSRQLCDKSVPYHLKKLGDEVYCASEIFTDENHSFLSFGEYTDYKGIYQKSIESNIDYIKRVVSQVDDDHKVDEMLITDALIFNRDRHYGNFGFLYNPDTMEIESFSPIFDFNQSLGFDIPDYMVNEYIDRPQQFLIRNMPLKAGGDCNQVIKHCMDAKLLNKIELCELCIPEDMVCDFWTENRNEMLRQAFSLQKEKIFTSHKYYNLSLQFVGESCENIINECECDF